MVILIALVAFFAIFFAIHKHVGPAHLAVIAGISVYELLGENLTELIGKIATGYSANLIDALVYIALVAAFPLLLYFRSARGGTHGFLRIAEAAGFAALLALLLAPALSEIFTFDTLAEKLVSTIEPYEGIIVLVGIISAYLDILLYHK